MGAMPTFTPFGPDHWVVLGCLGVASWLMVASTHRLRQIRDDWGVRAGLAMVLLGNEVIGVVGSAITQGSVRLPFQFCDLAIVVMAWALVSDNRFVTEWAFLWGLSGSLQAVLTPDVAAGFPSGAWCTFFLGHGSVVLGAIYLAARGRLRLTIGSVGRAWLLSNVYAAIAGLLNWRLGTNFGYLAHKPTHPSVLDYLGPWPVYLVGMEVIGVGSFALSLSVTRMIDRVAAAQTVKGPRHARTA